MKHNAKKLQEKATDAYKIKHEETKQLSKNVTHVQYTQRDSIRQNTLTNRAIGKLLRFVKEALRFVPFARMVSSSGDW